LGGALLLGPLKASAQDEPTAGEMLKLAMQAMQGGNYESAADYMYSYLGMVSESGAPRVIAIAQDIRFKLGCILIKENRLDEAAAVLQDYIDNPLANHPRQAMLMLATCYFDTDNYEGCMGAVTNALEYNENPVLLVKATTGDDDDGDYELEDVEPEPEYTQAELTRLHMFLAESYFNLSKWAECVSPFSYVIEHTTDTQRKGYSIMQVINALIELKDYDRILEWIPRLYRTDARYDIRVNLALMQAAAALYDEGEYDSALPLYRMILPRDELLEYQRKQLRKMRIAAGLPPEEGQALTADEMLLFGDADATAVAPKEENAAAVLTEEKPKELLELERLIAALENLPPYEIDIQYRMADLYKVVERFYESLKFFDEVFKADPESDVGERSIYEIVDALIENLDDIKEAEARGFDYMGKYHNGMTPRQIGYMLTGYYQKNSDLPSVKKLAPYLDSLVRTNDVTIMKYDTELYFMQAVADLMMQKYEESEKSFKYVLDEFPNSHQEANAIYWYAMSQLFLQKYADAFPNFEEYIKRFPSDTYVDECYFQGGICLFGQEEYTNALERFSYVIETYPDSSVYPEACSMRGDIYGSWGGDYLDKAVEDYERAYVAAQRVNQATYPTFQAAEIFEAEDRYDMILGLVERYETEWGDRGGDVAKALFWIGKTRIQQKKYAEAVQTYVDAIVRYGGDVRQDGVDLMITELVKISNIYLETEQQAKLKSDLQAALEATDSETLALRLRVTLAKLDRTENELGKQLLAELETLDNASPPVLATICNASFEIEDYSRAEELLRIFINKFEDSEFMRAAYKLRGYGQYKEKDYEGTLATINDAQALYGTDHDVAWAQLLKARVLLDSGDIDAARKENMSVLTVPAWRGEPVAEATYRLGQVEEAAGNLEKAFAFYQRTYFQYRGHAGGYWAAEAYLASAEILKKMGRENDVRNTYRAMLFDNFVNHLPQADVARKYLGAPEVDEIRAMIDAGTTTNISITVETELTETKSDEGFGGEAAETTTTEEG
jgi:TolA-binding protein